MASETAGKVITCQAAVSWAVGEPIKMETIEVAPPKAGEVRIKMVASGVCHTDLFFLRGGGGADVFPCILGHEGSGIVESVGEGVTCVAPGDHVLPCFVPQCYECEYCKSPDTNICRKNYDTLWGGSLGDGTSRFSCQGKPIKHFMGCSTFSEYTVCNDTNVLKINKDAPLEKICLMGCGIPTGYGAALNTAKVKPGSTVAIWGLGGVGLSVAMGARKAGAARVIGIDINPAKFEQSLKFGITECINPKDYQEPIENVLINMTNGGLDYAFECCGVLSCMKSALNACRPGLGVLTLVGLAGLSEEVSFNPWQILTGRSVKGTYYGGWKSRDQVPQLVEDYVAKEVMVDEFISHTMPLSALNEVIVLMKKGECLRCVVKH